MDLDVVFRTGAPLLGYALPGNSDLPAAVQLLAGAVR
jgi:hypothetical protein